MCGCGNWCGHMQLPVAPPPAPAQIMPLGQSAYDVHACGGGADGDEAASGSCAKAGAGAGPRFMDPHPIQIRAAAITGKKFFAIEDHATIQSLFGPSLLVRA
jgi:hypothetical protein